MRRSAIERWVRERSGCVCFLVPAKHQAHDDDGIRKVGVGGSGSAGTKGKVVRFEGH